ncbi:MAG TPA: hypothetical protein PKL04_00940 [Methanofastidiosum sp.]|nr:hypothetical protein [Methanofastidiosum sp.]
MNNKQLLKDIEQLMSKNGVKNLSIITEKGFLTKHYDLNMISSLMLAVNIIADKMVKSNELSCDQMDIILNDYVKIIIGNLKKNVRNEFN